METGPKLFKKRLLNIINNENQFVIINPDTNEIKNLKSNKLKVGRLDGCYYYNLSPENTFNLFYLFFNVKWYFLKYLYFLPIFTKAFNYYLNRTNRKIILKSDLLVFQSQLSFKMHQFFYKEEIKEYQIIYNGVPIDVFKPLTKNKPKDYINLVITAQFRLHKRLHEAINLVNYMVENNNSVKLHIIGKLDNLTKDSIKSLDISHCVFYGEVKSKDLPKYYKDFHIGLSPSLFDPCPNSVIEMMACGLPVITTLESGASELVGDSKLCIKENLSFGFYDLQTKENLPKISLEKWSHIVKHIIDNYEEISFKTLERVKNNFDINIIAKKYSEMINNFN